MSQTDEGQADTHVLRKEVARLRVENEQLRSHFRVAEPKPPDPDPREKPRPIRVLLLPDPLASTERGNLGPEALTNLARIVISMLSKRQPDAEWRAEHDLARVSDEAECFQLGQVLGQMFGGPLPMTFRVEQADDGRRCIGRCLIAGEPESDCFSDGYQRRLRSVDELLMEGQAACGASAGHHAGWVLKAVDVVLAQLKLAMVSFQIGGCDWRELLDTPRPEYHPRYEIHANQPAGW